VCLDKQTNEAFVSKLYNAEIGFEKLILTRYTMECVELGLKEAHREVIRHFLNQNRLFMDHFNRVSKIRSRNTVTFSPADSSYTSF